MTERLPEIQTREAPDHVSASCGRSSSHPRALRTISGQLANKNTLGRERLARYYESPAGQSEVSGLM
jgi:hypothetical protein